MKNINMVMILLVALTFWANLGFTQVEMVNPEESFRQKAEQIESKVFENLPVQNNGRIKPFHSFARETVLFLTGRYKKWGLDSIQIYLGIAGAESVDRLEIINVRDPELRVRLGYTKSKRYFSLAQLDNTPLQSWAREAMSKQEQNSRSLKPAENNVLEVFNQWWVLRQISNGSHFKDAVDFSATVKSHGQQTPQNEIVDAAESVISQLKSGDGNGVAEMETLKSLVSKQPMPAHFASQVKNADLELFYNKAGIFFWAGILAFLFGLILLFVPEQKLAESKLIYLLCATPILLIGIGLTIRVMITGFAPVTNMYGTMIWVAMGILLFSSLLFALYKNYKLVGWLWLTCSMVLLLAENLPLVLSPDMDPIVAVLRSNLWLTIHVLTITISYAAFTITMFLGNVGLIRSIWTGEYKGKFYDQYSKAVYRMIQLGVFLISVGIILGGVWADYSWGRFWGWDPKETWALIADLGYLAILHAKIVGWLTPFGVMAASTMAYLLVIMAWYGVNFILATGLHSYGFSSGGATAVLVFVILQVVIVGLAFGAKKFRKS